MHITEVKQSTPTQQPSTQQSGVERGPEHDVPTIPVIRALSWLVYVMFILATLVVIAVPSWWIVSTLIRQGSVISSAQTWDIGTPINSVSISPDSNMVAVGLGDGKLQVRQAPDGAIKWTVLAHGASGISYEDGVTDLTFSRDASMLASAGGDNVVRLWRTADGVQLHSWSNGSKAARAPAFSPDGTLIATSGQKGTVRIFSTATGQLVHTLPGDGEYPGDDTSVVISLVFSIDGRTLTTATADNMIYTWQMPEGTLVKSQQGVVPSTLHYDDPTAVSPQGDAIAHGDTPNRGVYLWQLGAGKQDGDTVLHDSNDDRSDAWSLAFSEDGSKLAKGEGRPPDLSIQQSRDADIPIWDVSTGKQIMILKGHTGNVNSVAWSTDDSLLVSGSSDGTVRIWHVR